jgi:hypothetical protein
VLGPAAQARLKQDSIIDEVYGKAGYKDAAERFFNPSEEEDQRVAEMQKVMQQMQGALAEAEKALKDKEGEMKTRVQVARISALGGLAKQEMATNAQKEQTFINAATGQIASEQDRQFQREQGESDRDFQMRQGEEQHNRSMQMQQAKQMPGGMTEELAGGMDDDSMSAQQLLGLSPPRDPMETMAPIIQTMMAGFQMIARQMQQQNAQTAELLAAQQQSTVEAILQSNDESQRQNMLITRQIAAQQQDTLEAVQMGNQQIISAMTAPKRVVRGPDGLAQAVVIDMQQQP